MGNYITEKNLILSVYFPTNYSIEFGRPFLYCSIYKIARFTSQLIKAIKRIGEQDIYASLFL